MRIKPVYGVHPSRCFGPSLGIDPLMPPKKCIYDCIYCPLGGSGKRYVEPMSLVRPAEIEGDLREFIRVNGCVFEHVLVWGMGDPLLNYYTPLIVSSIKEILAQQGCRAGVSVRTTGYMLEHEYARQVLVEADRLLVVLDTGPELRGTINNPARGFTLGRLVGILKKIPAKYKSKIWIEMNLLRIGSESNAQLPVIEELLSMLSLTGIRNFIVKPVNRPGKEPGIKPVRGKLLSRAIEKLVENDYNVMECRRSVETISLSETSPESIYNHVLRKPLSTREISIVYGTEGIREAERMVEAGYLEKITWMNEIFFKARRTIDTFTR